MKGRLLLALFTVFLFFGCSTRYEKKDRLPKNIILIIGDGMGYNHIDASKYYHGKDTLEFEKLPVYVAMSTYPASTYSIEDTTYKKNREKTGYDTYKAWHDKSYLLTGYTCSGPAATAMATGYKSAKKAIGVDKEGKPLKTIAERAIEIGKSAGVVTSVQFSHSTPACFGTHNVNRDHYEEIAREFILDSRFSVVMGCGHPYYNTNAEKSDTAITCQFVGGLPAWEGIVKGAIKYNTLSAHGNSMVQDIDKDGKPDAWKLITDSIDFAGLMHTKHPPKRVLGVATVLSTLQEERGATALESDYDPEIPDELFRADAFICPFNKNLPQLYQMAMGALNVLQQDEEGFFLMIEGGAIDKAGHKTSLGRIIEEMTDFNRTVDSVIAWVEKNSSWEETLLIITADHETSFMVGPYYPDNDIVWETDTLIRTYAILDNGKGKMPEAKLLYNNHTNQLVPLYAKGSGSDLFENYANQEDIVWGKYIDNINVAHVMFKLWSE